MDLFDSIFIVTLSIITVARLLLNVSIYRLEYDSDIERGCCANKDIKVEIIRKRDEVGVLFLLSLFTFFWLNISKSKNNPPAIWSNLLSVIFFLSIALYFNIFV